MVRILFLGEIVGRAGIAAIKAGLPSLKEKYQIDYVIANGEGVTGGFGIGRAHSIQLSKLGIDIVTGAEKLFYKLDMVDFADKAGFILRPANYPPQCPGKSYRTVTIKDRKFIFINLQGNSCFPRQNIQNSFLSIDMLLKKLETKEENAIFVIQYHAVTSAEKNTMKFFLSGRAAAVIGTHTKTLTADEMITDSGLAYITDNGRVGSLMSVGGFDPETEIRKLRTQMPVRSAECWDDPVIQGVIVGIDENDGKSKEIIRITEHVDTRKPEERNEAESQNTER